MARKHYQWKVGSPPPVLERHSQIKHEIVRDYLAAYIDTLVRFPGQEQLKLTLIDGFAGGGEYRLAETNEIVAGSPLILLKTTEEAEARINLSRTKPFHLDARFYYVEKDKATFHYLKTCIGAHGHGNDDRIRLLHGEFQSFEAEIISEIRSRGRACRAIFLLDQYGYNQVPTDSIKKILTLLPKAEVILNFNVDSLINFLNNKNWAQFARSIGAPELLKLDIEELKKHHKSIRRLIQEYLIRHLSTSCGADFFTPFFIQNSNGHGEYWLIHFSKHAKARDVMTSIHWSKKNYFVSYSHPGIDHLAINEFQALGFSDHLERLESTNLEFHFDSKEKCVDHLIDDIPQLLTRDNPRMAFGDFISTTANHSPATREIMSGALHQLLKSNEILICDANGKIKRSARDLKDDDFIEHKFQIRLIH